MLRPLGRRVPLCARRSEFFEDACDARAETVSNTSCWVDEAHLHIQLIEIGGRAVGARVLIPEAGGDLEIASKPAIMISCLNCCGA